MLPEITALIFAIVLLVAVVGGLVVLYRPPKSLKRFKIKDFEGEFIPHPKSVEAETAPLEPGKADATEAPPQRTALDSAPAEPQTPETPRFQQILDAFREHRYNDGMKLAKIHLAAGDDIADKYGAEAFYVWVASVEGNIADAYPDSEKLALAHPQNFDTQFYFGEVSMLVGKTEAALALLKRSLELASKADQRVRAATTLQATLSRLERTEEGLEIVSAQLQHIDDPALRTKLFVSMAEAYANAAPSDTQAMFLMYELAIHSTPDDTSLRFDVAHKYGEQKADELSYIHYQRLLIREPDNAAALNNIGVDAGNLGLPLTSVAYLRQAETKGSTLASANLANRIMDAGFKEEAERILSAAKSKDAHRNVSISIGRLAQAEHNEEQKLSDLDNRVGKVRRWHVRHGEALMQTLDPVSFGGSYAGVPLGLELSVQADGTASGQFQISETATGILTGKVRGAALTFNWVTESKDKGSWHLDFLGRKSGHGLLIQTAAGHLEGYRAEGAEAIDSKDVGRWVAWNLTKSVEP